MAYDNRVLEALTNICIQKRHTTLVQIKYAFVFFSRKITFFIQTRQSKFRLLFLSRRAFHRDFEWLTVISLTRWDDYKTVSRMVSITYGTRQRV